MEQVEKQAENQAHQNLMDILTKSAQANKAEITEPVKTEPVKEDTPEIPKVETPKAETPKVEKKEEAKVEKPVKEKFWKSKAKEESNSGTPEVENWQAKYSDLEKEYSSLKTQREQEAESAEIKFAKKIKDAGGIDKLLSTLKTSDPSSKSATELLKERTVRSLEKMYGKENITEDLIEDQLERIEQLDVITKDNMIQEERKFQLEAYNKEIEEFKPSSAKEAESFARDIEAAYNESLGKELIGLPVTEDRQKRMETLISDYSKGIKKLEGKQLYEALFFLEHKDEIFDNIIETYGNAKIEDTIAKVKGSEIRVGNTITPSMGSEDTPEVQNYNALRAQLGKTAQNMQEQLARQTR